MEDLKNIKFNYEFEDKKVNECYILFHNCITSKMKIDILSCIYLKELKDLFYNTKRYLTKNGSGFISFDGLLFNYYGLNKSVVSKMISVATRFCSYSHCFDVETKNVDNFYFIRPELEKFSLSKLFELLSFSNQKIIEFLDTGLITADTTVKEIREYVKSLKGGTKKENLVLEDADLQKTLDEQEAELPIAFDPQKEYEFDFYKSKSKSDLVGYCIDFQRLIQKLLKKKR